MASFWGEILPVSSRAVNDDDDDDDDEYSSSSPSIPSIPVMRDCNMIWNPELKAETVNCRLLIIADGEAAANFLDAALCWRKDSVLVGVLNSGFVQSESQFPPKSIESSKSCTIHRLQSSSSSSSSSFSDVVFVRNTAHVFPEQLHSWHRELFSRLDYKADDFDVAVLTTANVINYLEGPSSATQSVEPPFMRSLVTKYAALSSEKRKTKLPPLLETPNIVDGVAAQVLTACQVFGLRGAAFVVYAPARLEAATIEAFAPLMAPGGCLDGVVEQNPDLKTKVKDCVLKKDRGSLLYT